MSTPWIDEKYINLLGASLRNFKKLEEDRYQCSCPICGDSKKIKNKARGSFYVWKGEWFYNCYNGCPPRPFQALLKVQAPDLFRDYLFDTMSGAKPTMTKSTFKKKDRLKRFTKKQINISDCRMLSDLPSNHMAVSYIRSRLIPDKYLPELLFVPEFKAWTNLLIPGKFENTKNDEPRLIIPFRAETGDIFAYQGRSFDPKAYAKYITIKLDPEAPKIFGMNLIDPDHLVRIVEGPFDSMFIENCVADAGGDLKRAAAVYHNTVSIWDNEPRNQQIVLTMERAIHAGRKICIWPSNIPAGEDINDMVKKLVKNGMSSEAAIQSVNQIIDTNTFQGLTAELNFVQWRKV
jgi:hypothetical protein